MENTSLDIKQKIAKVKEQFFTCTPDEKIQRLLHLGQTLPPYPSEFKTAEYRIEGCQSILYLSSRLENHQIFFDVTSDALISAGLAALLIGIYGGETPATILNTPPDFLQDIGLIASLTPSRSNGLAHIHQRMKKDALKYLLSALKTMESNPKLK